MTRAVERALGVGTVGVRVTIVRSFDAFIDIYRYVIIVKLYQMCGFPSTCAHTHTHTHTHNTHNTRTRTRTRTRTHTHTYTVRSVAHIYIYIHIYIHIFISGSYWLLHTPTSLSAFAATLHIHIPRSLLQPHSHLHHIQSASTFISAPGANVNPRLCTPTHVHAHFHFHLNIHIHIHILPSTSTSIYNYTSTCTSISTCTFA